MQRISGCNSSANFCATQISIRKSRTTSSTIATAMSLEATMIMRMTGGNIMSRLGMLYFKHCAGGFALMFAQEEQAPQEGYRTPRPQV